MFTSDVNVEDINHSNKNLILFFERFVVDLLANWHQGLRNSRIMRQPQNIVVKTFNCVLIWGNFWEVNLYNLRYSTLQGMFKVKPSCQIQRDFWLDIWNHTSSLQKPVKLYVTCNQQLPKSSRLRSRKLQRLS